MRDALITIEDIKNRFVTIRGEISLLDRDVAAFYGVETKAVNQAVRNNLDKFPAGFVVELSKSEVDGLRSKILTTNISSKSPNSSARTCRRIRRRRRSS